MYSPLVDSLRRRLQRQVDRFQPDDEYDTILYKATRLWSFIQCHFACMAITEMLQKKHPEVAGDTERAFRGEAIREKDDERAAALSCAVLTQLASRQETDAKNALHQLSMCAAGVLHTGTEAQRSVELFVKPLCDYIDDQLDRQLILQELLVKYKMRCEWFRRSRLRGIAECGLEGETGERALALDLMEYVMDQGVEFIVESKIPSGRPDMVLRTSEGYIALDTKWVRRDAGHAKWVDTLAKGFKQVSRYCDDYNEATGFLVVFHCTQKTVRLDGTDPVGPFRRLVLGGYSVYCLFICVADLPSASRAGKGQEIVITNDQLMTALSATADGGG